MAPARAKTSEQAVITAARTLVERHGAAALSMQAVAELVGVRGPSLYKRFADRDQLLDAVLLGVLAELAVKLRAAAQSKPPTAAIAAMARAYRRFAKTSPQAYALNFSQRAENAALDAARGKAVAPLFEALRAWLDEPDVLPAARTLTAFLHGFVSMETAGAFRLGGDVQAAFDYGLERLLTAVQSPR